MKILLREILKKRELTLRQVEILTDVPKSTLARIATGEIPKMDTLEQIAKGLKLHISDLYDSEYK